VVTKAQTAYRKWYKAHRLEFNKARKERYEKDEEARKAIVERQRQYRLEKPRTPADGKHYRKVKGKEVQVFRIGVVSEMIGRDEQAIRIWEKAGRIPKPSIPGTHRYYTMGQVKLLTEWVELIDLVRYDHKVRVLALPKKSEEIKALWAGA